MNNENKDGETITGVMCIELKGLEIFMDDVPIGMLILNENDEIKNFEIYQQYLTDKDDYVRLQKVLAKLENRKWEN